MLSLWVRVQNALASEEGQWNPNSLLWVLVGVAILIAAIVFVWVNVDFNEKK